MIERRREALQGGSHSVERLYAQALQMLHRLEKLHETPECDARDPFASIWHTSYFGKLKQLLMALAYFTLP